MSNSSSLLRLSPAPGPSLCGVATVGAGTPRNRFEAREGFLGRGPWGTADGGGGKGVYVRGRWDDVCSTEKASGLQHIPFGSTSP